MQTVNQPGGREARTFIEEARRAQILEAAAQVVASHGYVGTSLAKIAETANVSKSVVSYHFDGKDELMRLLAHKVMEDTWKYMEDRVYQIDSPAQQIRAWFSSQTEYFAANRVWLLAMGEVVHNHRGSDGALAFDSDFGEELEEVTRILKLGQEIGEFRDFDAARVAIVLIRGVSGFLIAWAADASIDIETECSDFLDLILHSLTKEIS